MAMKSSYTTSWDTIGKSPDDLLDWKDKIDVFFDDALHHNPFLRRNLAFWLPFIKPGGVICGHDYSHEWPDVMEEADNIARKLRTKVSVRQSFWWIIIPG